MRAKQPGNGGREGREKWDGSLFVVRYRRSPRFMLRRARSMKIVKRLGLESSTRQRGRPRKTPAK
jgi:hypothetical protein